MQRIITRTVPVNGMLFSEHLPGMAYQGEQNAHRFVIHAVDDSAPVTLSGSVLAEFVRADGITVPVTGSIADGAAVVTLSGDCYVAIGRAELTIFVTASGATTAVYHAVTSVTRTRTDAVADQHGLIDLPALQARFEDMGEAISDAEAAAVAANQAAAAANAAAEAVSGDVAELKSAIPEKVDSRAIPYGYNKFMNDPSIWGFGGINAETGADTSPSSTSGRQRIRTIGYITGVDFVKWLPTSGWTNKINIYAYDNNGDFVETVAEKTEQFANFDYTQYKYRVTLARNTDETIDVALSRAVFLADKSSFATEGEIEEINTGLMTKTVLVKFEKGRFESSSDDDRYYNSLSETKAFMINAYPIIVDGAASVIFPAITLTDSDKYNIYWRDNTGEHISGNALTCAVDNNTVNVPSGAYYLDIMICYSGLYDFPIKIVGGNIKTGEQQKRIYTKDNGEQVCFFEVNRPKDVYSACCFMLPPNYNATGAKVPLVLWFDGNMNYRTLGSTFKPGKLPGLKYIRDEGYAVLQIYSWGSYFATKYAQCGDDQPYPSPTCLKVLETGLKWFCDRYNIDSENIHIVSKSMGGLISLFFVSHPIASFRSVSMFSPIIDMFGLRGRYSDARKAIFEDNALQGDVDDFSDINTDGSTSTSVENYYFSDRCLPIWEANKGATARLNSAYAELVGATFAENLAKSVEDSRAWYANHEAANIYNHPEYKKISAIPVKIWGATHDPDVQYQAMVQAVEQLRNSGCDAELKSVNSYDHSRFDVNTTDAQTITTELGILHENVPIGWVESIQWIRAHSVKYTVGS